MSEKTTGIISLTKIPADSIWLSAEKINTGAYSAIRSIAYGWRVKVMVTGLWSE